MAEIAAIFPSLSGFRIIARTPIATLHYAVHSKAQIPVAIKQVHGSRIDPSRDLFHFETTIMRTIDHPFVIKVFDVIKSHGDIFIILELLSNGSLLDFLNRGKPLMADVLRIFCQLVCALHYLHHHANFVHRDIKMENILFDEHMNIRLIDLCLGKNLEDTRAQTTTVCGSLPYCAPEIFQNLPYGKPVDIWSLGICFYGMALGKLPFESEFRSGLVDQILLHDPQIPPDTPAMIADLLSRMLKKSADERITIEELTQHPWIRNSVWAIYFDKSFQGIGPSREDCQETILLLKKCGLDPTKVTDEKTEEELVAKIMNRRKQSQMTAHPEMFLQGKRKFAISIPEIAGGPPSTSRAVDVSARPARVSLLDNIQQQTGVTVTKAMTGKGRRLMRPLSRVSSLYTRSGNLTVPSTSGDTE